MVVSAFCNFLCKAVKWTIFRHWLRGRIFREVYMKKVLPIIIICGVGIALCLAYIVFLCVRALRVNPPTRRTHEFEIEEDVLTVKLGKRKNKK